MKKLIKIFQVWNIIRKNGNILGITKDIFDFVCETKNIGRPLIKKIVLAHVSGNGDSITDFVTLWAGIGDANLIERLPGVINQRNSLKSLINGIKERDYVISEEDKKHIDIALKYFE